MTPAPSVLVTDATVRAGKIPPGERRFTTGGVARLLGVARRTAGLWIDSGRLKGYRIPGSKDRRVLRSELVAFCRREGIPVPPVILQRAVTTGCSVPGFDHLDAYQLGAAVSAGELAALLVGPDDGFTAAVRIGRRVRAAGGVALAVWLSPELDPDGAAVRDNPFDLCFPADARRNVALWLASHQPPETARARPE